MVTTPVQGQIVLYGSQSIDKYLAQAARKTTVLFILYSQWFESHVIVRYIFSFIFLPSYTVSFGLNIFISFKRTFMVTNNIQLYNDTYINERDSEESLATYFNLFPLDKCFF